MDARSLPTARRLERPLAGRMIAGVCTGLATYLAIDVVLVRVLFVVLTVMGGATIPLYVVLWVVMPEEGRPAIVPALEVSSIGATDLLAAILIIGGVIWLLANLGIFAFIQWSIVWPLVLVALGALLLVRGARR